jgi:hypothetical protein
LSKRIAWRGICGIFHQAKEKRHGLLQVRNRVRLYRIQVDKGHGEEDDVNEDEDDDGDTSPL